MECYREILNELVLEDKGCVHIPLLIQANSIRAESSCKQTYIHHMAKCMWTWANRFGLRLRVVNMNCGS